MKSYQLSIKLTTLACEARAIRRKEQKYRARARKAKAKGFAQSSENAYRAFWDLRHHRKLVVRPEARRTHLAQAMLRGHAYKDVEQPRWQNRLTKHDFKAIDLMVSKYSSRTLSSEIWVRQGKSVLECAA